MEARHGQERLSYGLCVLQILIFLKGARWSLEARKQCVNSAYRPR